MTFFQDTKSGTVKVVDFIKDNARTIVSFAGAVGITGFEFDVIEDDSVNLNAEITDHYAENNEPLQDDVVLKPIEITLKGNVGEIVDRIEKLGIVKKATRTIGVISAFVPQIAGVKSALLSNASADSAPDATSQIYTLVQNILLAVKSSNQAKAFMFFQALRNARIPLSVQTPFKYFPNMIIKSIKATQDGKTKDFSTFTITLKEFRTAQEAVVKKGAGSTLFDSAKESTLGAISGIKENVSKFLGRLF